MQWTTKEIKKLIELHKGGSPASQIAESLARTVTSVYNKICELREKGDLTLKNNPWTTKELSELERFSNSGLTNKQIGEKLGRSAHTVGTMKSKQGYTKERSKYAYELDKKILQLWRSGRTAKEIADVVGMEKDKVREHICYLRRKHGVEIVPVKYKNRGGINA